MAIYTKDIYVVYHQRHGRVAEEGSAPFKMRIMGERGHLLPLQITIVILNQEPNCSRWLGRQEKLPSPRACWKNWNTICPPAITHEVSKQTLRLVLDETMKAGTRLHQSLYAISDCIKKNSDDDCPRKRFRPTSWLPMG